MTNYYAFGPLARHLTPALAGVALLLAPADAVQAQTPTTFATPTSYGTGGNALFRVAVGDVNGDGRPDLVASNFSSSTISVLLAQAGGGFAPAATYSSGGTGAYSIKLGDLNGDSRLDIVVANNISNTVGVLLGQGNGLFPATATTYTSGGGSTSGMALGDVNNDGRLDIVTANFNLNTIGVFLGQGAGVFPATATTYGTGGLSPSGVALGDVNNDGRLDIVVNNQGSNTAGVLLGQVGGFAPAVASYSTGANSRPVNITLGDVNSDGQLDIVTVNNGSGSVGVLLGQGSGTYPATAATYNTGSTSPFDVALADLNGDNRLDIVAANANAPGTVGVLLGQGSGTFPATATTFASGSNPNGVELRDLNADGRPDIVVANNATPGTVTVLLNTGTFAVAPTLSSVNPINGPVGTSVTLTGTNFTGATGVRFNDTAASTFTLVNDGTITATVPTGAITGNVTVTTSAGTSNGVAFAVNPTVTITSAAGTSGSSTTTTPLPFTITFSQPVTGFVSGDITVTNGTVASLTGSGTTYSITVTPGTAGMATTVSVAANVAQTSTSTGNVASLAPFSLTYNAPVTFTAWTGNISTDWFTAGNWTAGVPTSTLDATIPAGRPRYPVLSTGTAIANTLTVDFDAQYFQTGGTLDLNGNLLNTGLFAATGGLVSLTGGNQQTLGGSNSESGFRFWDLTVGPSNARLKSGILVQHVLTLNGNLRSDGNLTLLSNATGTAMVVNNGSSTVTGMATMQRYIDPSLNRGLGYRHYSTPMQESSVSDVRTDDFSPVFNTDYNTVGNTVTPFPTMYGYDQSRITGTNATTQAFEYGYYSPAAGEQMVAGYGYTVNIGANGTVALRGTLNTGEISIPLARGTEANSGWQLLGNPYPAPLDWKVARLSLPVGVNDAVYVYKSSGQYDGSYQFYQNGFGTLPNGLIGQMQGFFLRVTQTVPAFSFQNTWRSTSYEATTFNRPAADTRPAVQLDLVSAQGTHEPAYVYFEAGATAGVDNHFDAEKLPNTTGLNLSSAAAGTSLAVNGLPLLASATTVPLHVGVPTTGTYTLQAASLLNLSATDVYLHDAVTGQRTNLKQQPSYSFTASRAALIMNRFSLHFGAQRPLSTQNGFTAASVSVYPNPAHAQFTLLLPAVSGATQAKVALCNVLGQTVREATVALPATGSRTTLDVQNLPAGVYVLRVQAGTATITKQVIVD